ncbi:MAG: pitrilysin family protein [Alphaproteobacteria bacterium]|nr:pitrilysin family protein [Alphaproteobacteria bacterium]
MTKLHKTVAAALLASLVLGACQPEAKTSASTDGVLTIAPLQPAYRMLDNGLKVYSLPDASTGSVSVQVWYDVGSKDDPAGRSGFAHLFEHLMFKATSNMPAEMFDRLTEDAGGFNNASTWNDFTNYYEMVPANHLERVLWGEAERMGSLVVDDATFKSERDVVKEEFRQSVLSQPYGKLFYLYLNQSAFDVHPYGRPGIGSIVDLDAATIDDVRAFHAAYYRPDNAVLVVAGNFDQAQLDGWVDRYFAPLKTPDRAIPRVTAVEPVRTEARDFTVYEPNVPLPAVIMSWPSPAATSPDTAALMLADAILARGQSSRLYNAMVYEQKLASEVINNFELSQQPGLYSLGAILSDGKSAEDGLASLRAEIAKLRDAPVTVAELDEARNELITEALRDRETPDGRAFDLARSVILFKDPQASDALLARLQTVTAEDIQRVAAAIMTDASSVTIRYLPEEMRNGAPEAKFKDSAGIQATKIDIPAADIPTYTLSPEGSRLAAPAAAEAIAARIPGASEKTLPNGLRVIVANKAGLPLVSANLRVNAGAAFEQPGSAGLAALTTDLATRGTATRSATQISSQVESLGATLGAGASLDSSDISASGRSDKAADILAIMSDVVQNPAFAVEELDRARQETLDGLMVALRQPSSIGRFAMNRVLFGSGGYGSTPSPKSIAAITREEVTGFHTSQWRPENAVLVIAGDLTPEAGFELAEQSFGSWVRPADGPTPPPPPSLLAPAASPPRSIVIDVPEIGQAAVLMGLVGPSRTDADYFPALVANDVLGGGYSARLNSEIRIKRGLSYGVRAQLPSRRLKAPIVASAQTRNDAVPQVVDLMSAELARLGSTAIPPAELEARKAVLIGAFGRDVETTGGLAGQLSALAQFGLPLDRLQTYASDISAVTPEMAGAAAKTHYDATRADLVVVGDAKVFMRTLATRRSAFERIAIDALNLDAEALK